MVQSTAEGPRIDVAVENIGGISETNVQLPSGVSVLEGENATNRTSFLQAIMGALGSDKPSLKADADSGRVELQIGEETYTRQFERTGTGVRTSGDPYLEDPTAAETFAFLLETNPARQAVIRGDDLRPVIMEPIDTTAIQAEITRKQARKATLDDELDELDALRNEKPGLAERLRSLDDEIEATDAELASVREEIAAAEADLSETKETKAALESAFETVQTQRSERANLNQRIEAERESLESARADRESLEAELESVPESVAERRSDLESQISTVRAEKTRLEAAVSELQNLIQFNEDLLDGEDSLLGEFEASGDEVTDRLVESGTVTCWTCGSTVDQTAITATVDRLRELRAEKLDRIEDLERRLRDLRSELDELESVGARRRELENKLEQVENEIDTRTESIADLENRLEELDAAIESTETEIEALEFADAHEELLSLHERANRLELELESLRSDRTAVTERLEEIEAELDREAELEAERADLTEELTALRTRVDRIEQNAIAEFNDRMQEILEIMGYSNVSRIWIERREAGESEPRFDLHVVRSDESGTAYEDTIDHLSESEREVTGLVFALAGYLVHDVSETVPFMVLDSVEALDSDRIARLVSYFEDHVPYLVIALLPEDAQALDETYPRVRDI